MRDARPDDAVITGAGAVTALGYGLAATGAAIEAGTTALAATPDANTGAVLSPAAIIEAPHLRAEVPREMMAEIKFLNPAGELAVEATIEAMQAADLPESVVAERRGLYLSQMDSHDWSCMELRPGVVAATSSFEQPLEAAAMNEAVTRGRKLKPHFMLESLKNNAFSFLATLFDLRGPNTSVAGWAGATHEAIDMGIRALARGSMDAAIICGAACPTSQVGRTEMQALHLEHPPGDAAATIVLERRADAEARGAHVSAAILGSGSATGSPAEGSTVPPIETLTAAIAQALTAAGVDTGELVRWVHPGLPDDVVAALREAVPALQDADALDWQAQTGHAALASETLTLALATTGAAAGPTLLLSTGLLGQAGALVVAPA